MLYNIFHQLENGLQRYDTGVSKTFVDKMVEAYLKGVGEITISGTSYKVGSKTFNIYSVQSEISDPNVIKKAINSLVLSRYGGQFSEKVFSDKFKNVTKRFLKGRHWGELKTELFNLYVNDNEKEKHYKICLDRNELQGFLRDWAAGKKVIWVDGTGMELEKPKAILIFDIKLEYLSKDKGDVKHSLRKMIAVGHKKWSLADFAYFGKDVTSDWTIPPYGGGLNTSDDLVPTKFDWAIIHAAIAKHSRSRFESNHYADAVEAAFKEINDVIKTEYHKIKSFEKDGDKLMKEVFSLENGAVRLADTSLESGRNIQLGYMEIFAGAMKGIRNPKAHKNLIIDELDAWEKIILASHLMKMWDNRIK